MENHQLTAENLQKIGEAKEALKGKLDKIQHFVFIGIPENENETEITVFSVGCPDCIQKAIAGTMAKEERMKDMILSSMLRFYTSIKSALPFPKPFAQA